MIVGNNGEVFAKAVVTAAEEAAIFGSQVIDAALTKKGLVREGLAAIVATGVGRNGVPFAHRAITEVSCDAKGAVHLFPSARAVIDIGAENGRGLRCDQSGRAFDFVMNEKCVPGASIFIDAVAVALELSIDEIAAFSLRSQNEVDINSTCAVFAESEVVGLIDRRVPREDIACGIHDSIAIRAVSMMQRNGIEDNLVFVGGAALNGGMVDALARRSGRKVYVPKDPVTIGAVGAVLYALEGSR